MAGAASHEALSSFLPPSASLKIKWPNDLYLNGKKVAGILSEMESEGDHIRWVVTGIGIDVNADEADFSPEVRKIATSLKIASNKEIDRQAVAGRFIEAFQKRYRLFLSEGPAPTIAFCNQHSYLKGRRVTIDGLTGTAMDLNASGHLEIKTDDGKIVPIASGDVALAGKVSD